MLRITTKKKPQTLVLRLEGRLEGPWVAVLEQSWSGALPKLRGRRLCIDLNGVTFVDEMGKARLAEMRAGGAELSGEGVEIKALVEEINARCASAAAGDGRVEPPANVADELAQLLQLQAELHEANEELAKSAQPLERVGDMSLEDRDKLGDKIRAGVARWESVTEKIHEVMGTANPKSSVNPPHKEGETR